MGYAYFVAEKMRLGF